MRVISGKFKGKQLFAPKSLPVRPTTDNAKEALFNILSNDLNFEELSVLELCSGTGGMALEFLSRGVVKVVSVDANYYCTKFQKETKRKWEIENWEIYKNDLFRALKVVKGKFDVIFVDPPYDSKFFDNIPDAIFEANVLNDDGLIIIEHSKNTNYKHNRVVESRKYGSVNFTFLK